MCPETTAGKCRRTKKVFLTCAVIFAVVLVLAALLVNAVDSARQAAMRVLRGKKMKALYVTLVNYASENGGLPPVHTTSSGGKPMQNWRVLLLPHWGEESLYSQIDLNEPWDSPANRRLLVPMPEMYRSPLEANTQGTATNYFAVVGPHAPWSDQGVAPWFGVGSSEAILLIEVPGSKTPWMEPWDPTLDELLDMLRPDSAASDSSAADIMYLTVDGDTRTVERNTDRESLRKVFLGEGK